MSYESKSVKELMEMIGEHKIYLPAIQRKFVWGYEQIESLFDSIMRGYPIGTFLFWFVSGKRKNEYTFYQFLDRYHERDRYLNDIAPKPELKEEIIGILDGQQRLSSMYIALQGTYAYKRRYARWESPDAFPEREYYLNILKDASEKEGEDFVYEFSFLESKEAKRADNEHLWFPVKEVLMWGKDPEIDEYYDSLLEQEFLSAGVKINIKKKKRQIKKTLRILHQRLVLEKLINYFRIDEPDLDNILDIFVRVNSGGTVLSKSDLLFSTIVANWQEGRQEIESFLEYINGKGDGFWFDNDFIMRSCLVLTDCPVLFKVRSFRKHNIDKIGAQWEKIKSAINRTVDLLVDSGFSGDNLTSQNAVIPIAYYFVKNGDGDSTSRAELRKYLIHSLLAKTYGAQGDRVLSSIREVLRKKEQDTYTLKHTIFSFDQLSEAKLPGTRTLDITEEDIEEILEYKKGSYTFMVLSLLYPSLKFGQIKFHQDHIHPASLFTEAKLKKYGISQEKWEKWQEKKDQLPNLQLMEGRENESKNKTPFDDWLHGMDASGNQNVIDVDKFMKDNYIPDEISLEFNCFEDFFETRKNKLRKEIKNVLL